MCRLNWNAVKVAQRQGNKIQRWKTDKEGQDRNDPQQTKELHSTFPTKAMTALQERRGGTIM